MKIAIVGGLGYIGRELHDLYYKTDHEVTIIDKAFDPVWLGDNVFNKFKLVDITKEGLDMSEYDIVYNLAGITMTYSTNTEKVMNVNYNAAINLSKTSKRYIFASTNNIFGGYDKQQNCVKESHPAKPVGPYATSKCLTEIELAKNHKNFIICRFGSNFGYSDGMTWSPVLNHFILNSIFNKPITLDKGLHNIRPFVNVRDTARALFFLAHEEDIKNEIFHVVSMNDSLYNISNKIKEINKSTEIIEIDKDNWFNGYEINSDKLKNLGFEYKYTLKDELNKMNFIFQNV